MLSIYRTNSVKPKFQIELHFLCFLMFFKLPSTAAYLKNLELQRVFTSVMKILLARKSHSICVWVLRIKLWCRKVFRKALFSKTSQYLWKKFPYKKTKELFFRKREFVNTLFKFFRLYFFPKRLCWCHNCFVLCCFVSIVIEFFLWMFSTKH